MDYKLIKFNFSSGFTLIEFMVVMFIMSIFLAYSVPMISRNSDVNINRSARKLAGVITGVKYESVFKKKNLRIMYDFDEMNYSIKEIAMTGDGLVQSDYGSEGESVYELDEGVRFKDIDTAYGGKLDYGSTYTHFFDSGMVERTLIHLVSDSDAEKTLVVNVLTGEVDIFDEYYEEDRL